MTRQPKRPRAMARISLADFIKARSIEAARAAMAEGGERIAYRISEKINSALNEPQVLIRIKAASPQERGDAAEQLIQIGNALAANDALPPNPERLVFAADRAGFGMNTTPDILLALLTEASAAVTNAADAALAESAANAALPTQSDLAAWIGAGNCPPEVLTEVAERLAVLWGLDPGKVRVTGWAFGGLVTWRDGVEFHAPAGELLATAKKQNALNPLAPLVKACPVQGQANLRPDRILAGKLAMVNPSHKRAGRLLGLFSPAAHRRGQMALPGFEYADYDGPALPLALYELGQDNPHRGGGPAAPLALRLFVEAVLAAPYDQRNAGQPVALQVTLRDLLDRLYPGPRKPRPNEYWPRLMRAVEALDSMDARIPWQDPNTGRGGLRRVVSVGDIPRGPGVMDDVVRIVVDLPPGSGPGPLVTPTLGAWGAKSAPAYSALLNLAYRWFDPGVTRHPVRGGHWLQAQDPERYPALSDTDVVAITRPLSARAAKRNLAVEGWQTLRQLEDAGELRIEGHRVLPPPRGESDVQPDD